MNGFGEKILEWQHIFAAYSQIKNLDITVCPFIGNRECQPLHENIDSKR